MSPLPELLCLRELGQGRFEAPHPAASSEGRDVVFSGQLLAQVIAASAQLEGDGKVLRSAHALFVRAGFYGLPLEVDVEVLHSGRTWASHSVSVQQAGRLLCRASTLLHCPEGDLLRHEPSFPRDVAGPEGLSPGRGLVFPGAEWRPVPERGRGRMLRRQSLERRDGRREASEVPVEMAWHRFPAASWAETAHQAVLAWATCGGVIGLALRPHRSRVRIEDAHRTLSTGVIGHCIHFLDHVECSAWHLFITEATKAAGGRVYGAGSVFSQEGLLVASFHQDGMARAAPELLDPRRSL